MSDRIIMTDRDGHYWTGPVTDAWTDDPREAAQFADEDAAMGAAEEGFLAWATPAAPASNEAKRTKREGARR